MKNLKKISISLILLFFTAFLIGQNLSSGKVAGIGDAPNNDFIVISQPFKGITGASTWMHIDTLKSRFFGGVAGTPQNLSSSEPTQTTRQISISGGTPTTINVGDDDVINQESEPTGADTLKIWVKTSTFETYRRDSPNSRWVKFQDKKVFENKSEVYGLSFIDNEIISIEGKDYKIKSDSVSGVAIDSFFTITTGNGKYAIYNEPEISSEIFGVKSIWDTIPSFNFTQGSNIITSTMPVFKSTDMGKVAYLRGIYSNAGAYEISSNFQTTVSNYASLPLSPVSEGIYKVTNASDDTRRDTLTGVQYYAFKSGGWVWLETFQDHIVTITGYVSPTQISIDYTPTQSGSNRSGYFGVNNKDNFEKFLRFCTSNNLHGYIQRGKIICKYPLSNGGLDDPIDLYTQGGFKSQISGYGRENTTLYLINDIDTNYNAGILTNDEIVPHAPFDIRTVSEDFFDITFSDFSVIRSLHNGYKRTDARSCPLFYIKGGTGIFTVKNVHAIGGDGFIRNSKSGWMSISINNHYQGNNNGTELGFTQYGTGEKSIIVIKNTLLENIGDTQEFSFNNKGRGISLYIRDESQMIIDGCTFRNIRDRLQFFSGGGSDFKDTIQLVQTINNTVFEHAGTYGQGIVDVYGGRVTTLRLTNNSHINKTGVRMTAIYLRGDTDILNCMVKGNYTTVTNFNSNNNIFDRPSTVNIFNSRFYEGQFDFFGQSLTTSEWNVYMKNCLVTPVNHTSGTQSIRFNAGTGATITRFFIDDCNFEGSDTSLNSFIFFESGAIGYCEIKNSRLNFKNAGGNHYLIKQFRGNNMQVKLIDNKSDGTVFGDIQSGLSGVGTSKIKGYGNNFKGWSFSTGNDTVQTVSFGRFLHSKDDIINYNYYVPDSTYFTTPFKRYLIKSDTVNYSGLGNLTMINGMYAIPHDQPNIYTGTFSGVTDINGDVSISINSHFVPSGGVFWIVGNGCANSPSYSKTLLGLRVLECSTGLARTGTSVNINYILFE